MAQETLAEPKVQQGSKQVFRSWTQKEDALLGTAPDDLIAAKLGRTRVSVLARRTKLKIPSANLKGPSLSPEERNRLAAPDATVLLEMGHKPDAEYRSLSQEDQERLRLVHGPYYPPRTRRGAFLFCEWRGTVRVGGYTTAPIPWPYALRSGTRSPVVCGDLARAVRVESEQAVAYHWNISVTTVNKWRQALGVEMWNAGSSRLLRRAVDLARTPEAREKISKAAAGRRLSPEHKQKLHAKSRLPKSEAFRRLLSEKTRQRMATEGVRLWTPEEEALLGTMPNRELAAKLGRSRKAVAARLFLKNAGRLPRRDRVVKAAAIQPERRPEPTRRKRVETPSFPTKRGLSLRDIAPPARVWKPEEDDIIRKHTITQAAQLLNYSPSIIAKRRRKLGIVRSVVITNPWTPEQIQLLGTKPDRILARKFGRKTGSVQGKRKSLGIPICPEKHFWRPADDDLLGKYCDEDIARLLKISVLAVKTRRNELKIPMKDSKIRPWTPSEEALVGTKPDAEVAKLLGRSLSAVRDKRGRLGCPYPTALLRHWTAEEDKLLGTIPDEAAARQLGRSLKAVKYRKLRLGL